MQIIGRVLRVRGLKNACFFDLWFYDATQHSFKELKCVIQNDNGEKTIRGIFPGAVLKLNKYHIRKDKKQSDLLSVNEFVCYNDPSIEQNSPYPTRFHLERVEDKELLYKDRGYAFTVRPSLVETLSKKYRILNRFRTIMESEGFVHVNIPILQTYPGTAESAPFTTLCNDNGKTYYLRTCFEFALKGLIIGGFPAVYHVGSCFRNQALDKTHSPEFLFCEAYVVNKSLSYFISLTERIYSEMNELIHKTSVRNGFDLRLPWPIYERKELERLQLKHQVSNLDELLDLKVLGPFFHVKGYPTILAKTQSARIQSYCDYTTELCNFYEEENSATSLRQKSRTSANPVDSVFLNYLSYGMPETVGWGIGLDRLIASILAVDSLRGVHEYPLY